MVTGGRRGPQRSETARLAILTATAAQFTAHGYDHLTMDRIAAEAHVGKQTIYRWWSSKAALVADCLAEGLLIPDRFVPVDSGDLRADLIAWVRNVVEFTEQPGNEGMMRSLVSAAADHEDVALKLNERLGLFAVLGARMGTDAVEIGEALVGALVIRALRRGPLDADFAERLVDALKI